MNDRHITTLLLAAVDEGIITHEMIAIACLHHMSEDDVENMANDIVDLEELLEVFNENSKR